MSFFSFKKFLFLAASVFSGKSALLIIAYLLSESEYNIFNKAYYSASLLIIFGSLGFGYALVRMRIRAVTTVSAVVINLLLSLAVISYFFPPDHNPAQTISIFFYSLFSSLGSIYIFRLLFLGHYSRYSLMQVIYALLHIMIVPVLWFSGLDLYLIFPFVTLFWLAAAFTLRESDNLLPGAGVAELYKTGITAFVINSSVPIALIIDKYIINHHFPLPVANAYTFAWVLTAPLFYAGNVVEKMIYSTLNSAKRITFLKSIALLGGLIIVYTAAANIIISYFPALLPRSINIDILKEIFLLMITGYSIYILLHFPVNGLLFRFNTVDVQKRVASWFVGFIIIYSAAVYLIFSSNPVQDYMLLMFIVWIFLFALLGIKIFIMLSANTEKK